MNSNVQAWGHDKYLFSVIHATRPAPRGICTPLWQRLVRIRRRVRGDFAKMRQSFPLIKSSAVECEGLPSLLDCAGTPALGCLERSRVIKRRQAAALHIVFLRRSKRLQGLEGMFIHHDVFWDMVSTPENHAKGVYLFNVMQATRGRRPAPRISSRVPRDSRGLYPLYVIYRAKECEHRRSSNFLFGTFSLWMMLKLWITPQ